MRNVLLTLKGTITEPSKFFKAVTKEKTVKEAFLFYFVFWVISVALFTIAYYFGQLGKIYAQMPFFNYPIILAMQVVGLGFLFFIILIFHGFFKLFKGKGSYVDTFKTYIYAMGPGMIYGLVYYLILIFVDMTQNTVVNLLLSLVNLVFMVWVVILVIIGGSILHKISKGRAFLAGILVPGLIFFVLMLIFVVAIGFMMVSQMSAYGVY